VDDRTERTLNQLEGPLERPSGLSVQAARAYDLRDVPLGLLGVADLRILITEQQGLAHVIPLALDILATDPDASGGRFAGDLLASVERLPSGFWITHPALRHKIERIQARRWPE
jgi:CDI immunity proteins